jgi:hypothetical protein
MENKILILLVTFTLVLSFYPFQVKGDGENWLSGWQYRRPITINNPGSALNDYQVLVNLDTASLISAGKIRSDYGDIRFTDSDGKTQLNYWNEGYYFDDFNDNILDGWTATNGTWSISNGEVTQSSALIGEQFLVWNKVASNFVFEARQIATSGAYIGIIFRYQDINNMYMLELCTSACTANELQLWKKVAGNWIKIASVSETTPLTQWNTLRVEANGNSIKGYLNGQLKITATDTSFSSGKFGLATAVSTTGKFDDVRVAEIPTKIWVKVPSIPASSTKTIYVYYGNPTATSLSNSLLVFDNLNYAYSASWHIWDDSTCGGIFSEWVSVPPTYVKGPLVDIYIKPSSYGGFLFSICVYDSISNSWKRPYITWTEADGIWGRFNTGNSVWSVTKVAMRHTSVGWFDPTNVKFGGSTAKYASPEPTISIGNEETPSTTTTTLPQDDPCDNSGTWRKYYPYCCEGGDCTQDRSKLRGFCLDKNRYQTYIQDLELIREGSIENCVKCKNERCCHEIRGFCFDYDSSSQTGCVSPRGIVTRACGDAGGNRCDIPSNLQGCVLRESSSKLGPVYCALCGATTPPITTTFTTTSTITTTPTLTTTFTTTPTTTSTTIPQCDSSSYTTCSNAYTFTTSDSKSNMCGNEQYYKISTPEGKKCDIEWKVIPDSQSDYDLYVKWDSNCPSRTNYDCSSTLALGVTDICSKRDFSGTTYALVRKFSGISYRIEVSVTNCKDITTPTTSATTTFTTTPTTTSTTTTRPPTTTTPTPTSTTTTINTWSISLSANPTSSPVGSSSTITATANQDVGLTVYHIRIYEENTVIKSCYSGTSCSIPVTKNTAGTYSYVAKVEKIDGTDTQATSNTVTVTWTTLTPHTTTTLTTTSIKEFKVREFNCVKSGSSYSCMIFYEKNYGRNVYIVFFVSDTEGRTVTNSNIYTLQLVSGSTPSYTLSCSGRTGDYYIYWIVYEYSNLKNPKWWSTTNEWKRVTC